MWISRKKILISLYGLYDILSVTQSLDSLRMANWTSSKLKTSSASSNTYIWFTILRYKLIA